jgi:hypothetical protein
VHYADLLSPVPQVQQRPANRMLDVIGVRPDRHYVIVEVVSIHPFSPATLPVAKYPVAGAVREDEYWPQFVIDKTTA